MAKRHQQSILFLRFVTALAFVLVLLLPTISGTLANDCDDNCNDPCESVCICIGCPSIVVGIEIILLTHSHTQNVLAYSIITPSIGIQSGWLDRVDRPPQTFL